VTRCVPVYTAPAYTAPACGAATVAPGCCH
jgi:hypothetical protein